MLILILIFMLILILIFMLILISISILTVHPYKYINTHTLVRTFYWHTYTCTHFLLTHIHLFVLFTHTQREHQKGLLVEWLEYHRLVGVQHFFMYDTSTPSPISSSSSSSSSSLSSSMSSPSSLRIGTHVDEDDLGVNKSSSGNINDRGNNPYPRRPHGLRTLLADYIRLGIVTIIPWTHAECDKVVYTRDNSTNRSDGASCPPISVPSLRSVALSSCYLR